MEPRLFEALKVLRDHFEEAAQPDAWSKWVDFLQVVNVSLTTNPLPPAQVSLLSHQLRELGRE